MGVPAPGQRDLAGNVLAGSFTGTGQSAGQVFFHRFNVSIWGGGGSWAVRIERSFDGGTTWLVVDSDTTGTDASYATAFSGVIFEPEPGVLYRLNCTAYGSAAINYRLSQ